MTARTVSLSTVAALSPSYMRSSSLSLQYVSCAVLCLHALYVFRDDVDDGDGFGAAFAVCACAPMFYLNDLDRGKLIEWLKNR